MSIRLNQMSEEIEFKFFIDSNQRPNEIVSEIDNILKELTVTKKSPKALYNAYYDTDTLILRKHDIGLRVRAIDEKYEETAKCGGVVIGGLHKRVEYNIPIESSNPILSKFPTIMWQELDVEELQKSIKKLFSTDFIRNKWIVQDGDRYIAEICYDYGKISVDSNSLDINEIEIELLEGTLDEFFDIAKKFVSDPNIEIHLDSRSKAHRGYELANLCSQSKVRSFYMHNGNKDESIKCYLKQYLENEQLLLANYNSKSLSVMILAIYQLKNLTGDSIYTDILAKLDLFENAISINEKLQNQFMELIRSKNYLMFILDVYKFILDSTDEN